MRMCVLIILMALCASSCATSEKRWVKYDRIGCPEFEYPAELKEISLEGGVFPWTRLESADGQFVVLSYGMVLNHLDEDAQRGETNALELVLSSCLAGKKYTCVEIVDGHIFVIDDRTSSTSGRKEWLSITKYALFGVNTFERGFNEVTVMYKKDSEDRSVYEAWAKKIVSTWRPVWVDENVGSSEGLQGNRTTITTSTWRLDPSLLKSSKGANSGNIRSSDQSGRNTRKPSNE